MGKKNLGERIHYVPLLAAAQISATTDLNAVNAGLFNQVDFIIQLGAVATANFTLTVEECTASTSGTGATAVAAEYRVSAAAGTDTMGAVNPLSTSGATITATTDNNKCIIVTVDSDSLTSGYKYVRPTLTPGSSATAYVSIVAACYPRYMTATPGSALT